MASRWVKYEDIPRLLQELSDEEKEDNNEEADLESDSDLSDENIEVNCISSESEQSISEDEQENAFEDEEFYIGKDKTTKWRKIQYTKCSKTKKLNIVKVLPGIKTFAKNIEDEVGSFMKIIDLNMIDEILKCTNQHINQLRSKHNYSRERDCQDVTRCEMMAYFGLLYLIGIKKGHHANVKELFSNDGTGIEIARSVMSYKRFLFLTRCLRFDDRTTRISRRKEDKLAALRTIFDCFLRNCNNCYSMSEFATIDEMLHPFRGRCQWIQYIPSKPAKYGIKMYALCDSKTFYTYNLEIYCGLQPNGPYAVSNSPLDVVKRLVTPIENSRRNITTDNYYTSIPLADFLLQKKLTLVGTLKKNKKEIPPEFLPCKEKVVKSTIFGFQKDKALVSYVPRKNKAVILLSTMHDTSNIDKDTGKPEIILDYNSTKGGVDTVDKMCATYSVSRITRRWPCAVFYSLMNIAGINAQILYMLSKPAENPPIRRIFLKNLALGLMKEHLTARAKIRSLPRDITTFLSLNYALPSEASTEEERTQEQQVQKRGTCGVCVKERRRSSASMKCYICNRYTCKQHSLTKIRCLECQESDASD